MPGLMMTMAVTVTIDDMLAVCKENNLAWFGKDNANELNKLLNDNNINPRRMKELVTIITSICMCGEASMSDRLKLSTSLSRVVGKIPPDFFRKMITPVEAKRTRTIILNLLNPYQYLCCTSSMAWVSESFIKAFPDV